MAFAVLALSPARRAQTIKSKSQPAPSFAGLLFEVEHWKSSELSHAQPETSTRWMTSAVMYCTESCVVCGRYEERGTLINAGDLL
jgi:hypothetical protein